MRAMRRKIQHIPQMDISTKILEKTELDSITEIFDRNAVPLQKALTGIVEEPPKPPSKFKTILFYLIPGLSFIPAGRPIIGILIFSISTFTAFCFTVLTGMLPTNMDTLLTADINILFLTPAAGITATTLWALSGWHGSKSINKRFQTKRTHPTAAALISMPLPGLAHYLMNEYTKGVLFFTSAGLGMVAFFTAKRFLFFHGFSDIPEAAHLQDLTVLTATAATLIFSVIYIAGINSAFVTAKKIQGKKTGKTSFKFIKRSLLLVATGILILLWSPLTRDFYYIHLKTALNSSTKAGLQNTKACLKSILRTWEKTAPPEFIQKGYSKTKSAVKRIKAISAKISDPPPQ